MSNRELPMMPWYPDQFASATAQWTYAERSAYRALLDVQWALGVLDPDPKRLAESIRLPLDEFLKIWTIVGKKFIKVDGGIQNFRLEQHRLEAFRLKQSRKAGAQFTNAQRSAGRGAERPAERDAGRTAGRSAERHASVSPLSPSLSEDEEHPQPPQGGRVGLAANGGRRPREERDRSLSAWRAMLAETDRVAATGSLPAAQRLTWADIRTDDKIALKAAQKVGFRAIADRDKYTTKELQSEFREAYEQEQARAQQ